MEVAIPKIILVAKGIRICACTLCSNSNGVRPAIILYGARLQDAAHTELSLEGRFDLAYNAAHALCLAALRWHGYRPVNRYIVFQVLPQTLGLGPEVWRVLAKVPRCS